MSAVLGAAVSARNAYTPVCAETLIHPSRANRKDFPLGAFSPAAVLNTEHSSNHLEACDHRLRGTLP